jgi:hypothetical protein
MKAHDLLAKIYVGVDVTNAKCGVALTGATREKFIMHEDAGQIAFEEEPGVMLVDFSPANCVNCEYPQEIAQALQEHREAVVQWIADKGFEVDDCTGE